MSLYAPVFRSRIQELCGSGSVFLTQIRIHTSKFNIKQRQKLFTSFFLKIGNITLDVGQNFWIRIQIQCTGIWIHNTGMHPPIPGALNFFLVPYQYYVIFQFPQNLGQSNTKMSFNLQRFVSLSLKIQVDKKIDRLLTWHFLLRRRRK